MIFDIAAFLAIKIVLASCLVLAIVLIPCALALPVITEFRGWGRRVLLVVVSIFYVAYLGWVWPFGLPPKKGFEHPLAAAWQSLIEPHSVAQARDRAVLTPPVRVDKGTELRRYRLDGWTRPKHVYVELTELSTGQSTDKLYVSKHCNSHTSLRAGDEYTVKVRKYVMSDKPDEIRWEFDNLHATFCS